MPQEYYGVVEMTFSFGVILIIAVWQLVSLEKAKKRTREKLARQAVENPAADGRSKGA